MDKTIFIRLAGQASRFELTEEAHDRLAGYLDKATQRLRDDPDRAEVLGDLERSVGDKLAALAGAGERLVTPADIDAVLDQIGTIETGHEADPRDEPSAPRRRRLERVREGKELAGVCTGLSAYSEIGVDWVRTIFVLGTLATAGILGIVYLALAFLLPIRATRAA